MNDAPLVRVKNVTVQRDLTTILDDFSWTLHQGENWVIFGPNGAGKTSLLNVIQGYLWPTTGSVHVFGGTLGDGVDVREMRRAIPVVSESVRNMIHGYLTGLEVIITGARAHLDLFEPATPDELEKSHHVAAETGLEPLLHKPFGVMSTGERQRILIARALMPDPRIIVLDEPCSGLDLAGREWVLHAIETISGKPSAPAMLLTTHHAEEIAEGFTHALLIGNGRCFAAGPIQETFSSQNLSELFKLPLTVSYGNGRWGARATPK